MKPSRLFAVAAVFAVTFVVGAAIAPAATALPPNCWLGCDLGYSYTATLTGHGIDCAHALSDLQAQLNAAVSGECHDEDQIGFCERTVVITQDCTCNGCCDYTYQGYMKYRCRWCLPY